jgi:hypothetical protein
MAYPEQHRQNDHQEDRGRDPAPGRITGTRVGVVYVVAPERIFRTRIVVVGHNGSPSIVDAGCQRRPPGSRSSLRNEYRLRKAVMAAELATQHDVTEALQRACVQCANP